MTLPEEQEQGKIISLPSTVAHKYNALPYPFSRLLEAADRYSNKAGEQQYLEIFSLIKERDTSVARSKTVLGEVHNQEEHEHEKASYDTLMKLYESAINFLWFTERDLKHTDLENVVRDVEKGNALLSEQDYIKTFNKYMPPFTESLNNQKQTSARLGAYALYHPCTLKLERALNVLTLPVVKDDTREERTLYVTTMLHLLEEREINPVEELSSNLNFIRKTKPDVSLCNAFEETLKECMRTGEAAQLAWHTLHPIK